MRPNPVSETERLESLDLLRGFALLGILAMNIRMMAGPFSSYVYPYALYPYEGASRAAYIFTTIIFELKMMGLFSMLFGAGVLLYASKPTASGAPPRALWFRRMFWLLMIGVLHAYLIWDGDILVPYALCGLILLWWARRLSARTLLVAAVVMLSVGGAMNIMHGVGWDSMPAADRAVELPIYQPTPDQARQQLAGLLGSYTEIVAQRAPFVFMAQTMYFFLFFLWRCGGMMLLGMALYKYGFLEGRWSSKAYLTVAAVCLPLGLGLAAFGITELERVRFVMPPRLFADSWNYVGSILASVGYGAALLVLMKQGVLAALRRRLAAVGQMAFTNYLTHSLVTAVIFLGWGFGLAGRLHYGQQLIVVVTIWIAQLVISPIWLARYRFGPAEWLWRSLTYGQRQPFRRGAAGTARVGSVPAGA